ncbi:penicillin-binding transpeptidase domain-containing protein [Sporanaerobium hydrogeniformans]|uniref:penicillin-binding transpeptidase domain-containing protein n=1 Tax=Sporanaerobium hydrogeniformans TaxID=3072179 RepID=UPI0015D4E82B|nr:penicillin-binding transpeptidase domain-containing protein [Sporanaerobium hydrogeniformans]
MTLKKINQKGFKILQDRILFMAVVIGAMFAVLFLKFYKLQILDHDKYAGDLRASVERTVEIPSTRGMIYDRYGKPLAINKPVYVLKIDQQAVMKKKDLNALLLKVIQLLEKNGDTYKDMIPLSKTEPFSFTESETAVRSFITNYLPYNGIEHRDELAALSAEELFHYLRGEDVFQIDPAISNEDARKIMALRVEMYQYSYQKYKKVILAENISEKTLATIDENQNEYPSILAEVDAKRYYPYGKEFGNVLGYTRAITANQYESMKEKGYDKDDIIGQMGIELSMEEELKGQKGIELIEVDNVGRKVFTLDKTDAVQGNNVFLTIDADLQLSAYQAIEKRLSEAIVQRIKGGMRNVQPLTGREILVSMVRTNQLNLKTMEKAPKEHMQRQLYEKIKASYDETIKSLPKTTVNEEGEEVEVKIPTLKEHFVTLLEADQSVITNRELLLALSEQGSLKLDENLVEKIWNNAYPSLESILIQELESGDLKPDQLCVDPFSASAVVVDVKTGEVLTLVGYPSYDSNEMTNNFNSYYTQLQDELDKRHLLTNRALRAADAPGSTFKMIVALAGLEEGVITANTQINDTGIYTKAGTPYPKCWIQTNSGHGHGLVDLKRALEVSCNFYFYDVAYRLGLKSSDIYGGIDALTKYALMFGLDQKTGIELEEMAPNISHPSSIVKTNMARAINIIKDTSDERKKELRERIGNALEKGFYPYGSSKATDIEGRIDYLTQYEMKLFIDSALQEVLSDNIEVIWEKMLEDFQKEIGKDSQGITNQLIEQVLNDTSDSSLKSKSQIYLNEKLLAMVSSSTNKLITKSINNLPKETVEDAYYKVYSNAIRRNQNKENEKQYVEEMERRLQEIEAGTFDANERLVAKVKESLMDILLAYLFENIDMTWNTGITVRTAIGQGQNAFTPVQMARYIAGLANGEEVYDLRVVNGIFDNKETGAYEATTPKIYNTLHFKKEHLEAVYQGMYNVAKGREGTARTHFTDYPIEIGAKTGTVQKNNTENAFFVGFAPYDNPQIAVVTNMYVADGLGTYNTQLAKDILSAYFKLNQEPQNTTIDNQLVP